MARIHKRGELCFQKHKTIKTKTQEFILVRPILPMSSSQHPIGFPYLKVLSGSPCNLTTASFTSSLATLQGFSPETLPYNL